MASPNTQTVGRPARTSPGIPYVGVTVVRPLASVVDSRWCSDPAGLLDHRPCLTRGDAASWPTPDRRHDLDRSVI